MKKILFLLTLLLSVGMGVVAQSLTKVDGMVFSVYNVGTPEGYATFKNVILPDEDRVNLVIPDKITYEGQEYPVTEMEERCLFFDKMIVSLTLPKYLKKIGSEAIYGCTNIKKLEIPGSVTRLDNRYDYEHLNIEEYIFADSDELLDYPMELCFNKNVKKVYLGRNLKSYPIDPELSAFYNDWTFSGTEIEEVTIGPKVRILPNRIFNKCHNLRSVTIPNGLDSIGQEAFRDCDALKSIKLPSTLRIVEYCAFKGCKNLVFEGGIPENLEIIGYYAFSGTNVTKIDWPANLKVVNTAFSECEKLTEVNIPEGVTGITDYALYGCTALATLKLPQSLQTIGTYAFSHCKEVNISASIRNIGAWFWGVLNLEKLIIEDSERPLETPSVSTFPSALKEIYIGRNIHHTSTPSLTLKNSPIEKFSIGPMVTEFGNWLAENESIKEITIPETILTLSSAAFYSCKALERVTLPESLTAIGVSTFRKCKSLESITLPKSISKIGDYAFDQTGLKEIYVKSPIPPTGTKAAFSDNTYLNATVFVPEESANVYNYSAPWIYFSKIVGVDFSGIEEVGADADEAEGPVEYFDLSGMRVNGENLAKGIYLRRQGTKVTKVAVN